MNEGGERVSIRASFERFPATVKGAFVLRGADRNPHQVRIDAARVREISGRGALPIGLDPVTLDVAPNLDLFVPFEFAITELAAGWYGLECDVGDRRRSGERSTVETVRRAVAAGHGAAREREREQDRARRERAARARGAGRVRRGVDPGQLLDLAARSGTGASGRRRRLAHDPRERVRRRERSRPGHRVPGDAVALAAEHRRPRPPGAHRARAAASAPRRVGGAR